MYRYVHVLCMQARFKLKTEFSSHYTVIFYTRRDALRLTHDDMMMVMSKLERFTHWPSCHALEKFCESVKLQSSCTLDPNSFSTNAMYPYGDNPVDSTPMDDQHRSADLGKWLASASGLVDWVFSDQRLTNSRNRDGYDSLACDMATITAQVGEQFQKGK